MSLARISNKEASSLLRIAVQPISSIAIQSLSISTSSSSSLCSVPTSTSASSTLSPILTSNINNHNNNQIITNTFHTTTFTSRELSFNLADIGEGIAECEIMQWFIKVGDHIKQFDKVCEVQSDKATVEITSRYDGIVKKLAYNVGEMAKVGAPLIMLEVGDSGSSSSSSSASGSTPASPAGKGFASPAVNAANTVADANAMDSVYSADKVLAAPAVRAIARAYNVDIRQVQPTGPGKRVIKEDILRYIKQSAASPSPSSSASSHSSPSPISSQTTSSARVAAAVSSSSSNTTSATSPSPSSSSSSSAVVNSRLSADKVEKVTGLQRIMVQTMTAAREVPTFLYCDEIVMDELIKIRSALKASTEKMGIKLSYLPFIVKAASLALLRYPKLNAHVNKDCSEVTIRASHNIALAMDTPRGLLVPNIKNVQDKSVIEIARELKRLQELGAAAKLGPEDLNGGTFTLSNVGTIGGTYAYPVIVVPQVVIGALGKIQLLPRYSSNTNNKEKELKPTSIINVSWSADHRVVEGAVVANFSNVFKDYIEKPAAMLLDMK